MFKLVVVLALVLPMSAAASGPDPEKDGWTARGLVVKAIETAYGEKVAADGWDGELPQPLPALVHKVAKDPKDAEATLVRMRKHTTSIAAAWSAYEARAREVTDGIAKAKELVAAKDRVGAKQILRALITAAPPKSMDRIRTPVHPNDAEVPALQMLADLLGADKEYGELVGLVSDFRSRVWVGSKEEEFFTDALRWERDYLRDRAAKQRPIIVAIANASRFYDHLSIGIELASSFYDGIDRYGIKTVRITELAKAKQGEWIHFPLPVSSLDESLTTATLKFSDSYQRGTDCYKSGVQSINWHHKEIRYSYTCRKYVPVKIKIDVTAKLAAPAPKFEPRFRRFVVFGKVAKSGGKVELVDAFVPDLTIISKPREVIGHITEDE